MPSQPVQFGRYAPAQRVIVHLSDTHLLAGNRLLGGRYDTAANLAATLAAVERTGVRPDAIVFTGDLTDLGEPEADSRFTLSSVFRKPYLTRTLFVCFFWMCQIIPMMSIYSFSFDVMEQFNLKGMGAEVFLAVLFVVGGIPGLYLVDKIGRKALLVWTFAGIAIIWGLGGLIPGLPTGVLLFAVCAFALLSGASNFLEIVYPNELFPTQVRATAVGIGTAASRIGSASAVYLMPFILDAVRAYATLGEMMGVLRQVFGEYMEPTIV